MIGDEEIRFSWEYNGMYMITNPFNPLFHEEKIGSIYQGIKKIQNLNNYSSHKAEKISIDDLKKMINEIEI